MFNRGPGWNTTVVPAGTVYAETSAVLVFDVGEEDEAKFEQAKHWTELLREPLHVRIEDGVCVLPAVTAVLRGAATEPVVVRNAPSVVRGMALEARVLDTDEPCWDK